MHVWLHFLSCAMFHIFYITFVFLPSLMVVTRGPGLQHNSLKKIHLIGAILAGKNVAQSACLMHMPYTTALDIWKKYKKNRFDA